MKLMKQKDIHQFPFRTFAIVLIEKIDFMAPRLHKKDKIK
jgi:hypothetical protein